MTKKRYEGLYKELYIETLQHFLAQRLNETSQDGYKRDCVFAATQRTRSTLCCIQHIDLLNQFEGSTSACCIDFLLLYYTLVLNGLA